MNSKPFLIYTNNTPLKIAISGFFKISYLIFFIPLFCFFILASLVYLFLMVFNKKQAESLLWNLHRLDRYFLKRLNILPQNFAIVQGKKNQKTTLENTGIYILKPYTKIMWNGTKKDFERFDPMST